MSKILMLWILWASTAFCQTENNISEASSIQNLPANGKAYYAYKVPADVKPKEMDLFFYLNTSSGNPVIRISSVYQSL